MEAGNAMKLTHKFAEMTPEKRPQAPKPDGTGLRFETMEHGGEYPDTMPQVIKLIDAEDRSCICRSHRTARWSTAMALFWIRRTNDGRLLRDGRRTLLRSNDAQGCHGSCLKT